MQITKPNLEQSLANSPQHAAPVDVTVHREWGPFPGATHAHGVAREGNRIWYATGDRLLALDPVSATITASWNVQSDAGTAYDGTYLYQLAGDSIHKVDPRTGRIISRIPAPAQGRDSGMAWAEGSLWVGEYQEGKIRRIDPETGEIQAVIHSDRFVTGVAWHRDELWHGSRHEENCELRQIGRDGTVQRRLRLPSGLMVSGLDIDSAGDFICGGGTSGKLRLVKRPENRDD